LIAGVVLAAWVPRARTASQALETYDETLWLGRSARFVDALAAADLAAASAAKDQQLATMPGVTTMWTGAAARGIWGVGRGLGTWASEGQASFASSDSGRVIAQVLMATAAALLIGLLTVLVARWAGWRTAAVAGLLVATEPFLVAQGAVVHTDEMRELLGACALVATALVLGIPQRTPLTGHRRLTLAAGALFGLALLTKISALTLVPGVAAFALWAHLRGTREADPAEAGGGAAVGQPIADGAQTTCAGEDAAPAWRRRGVQAAGTGDLVRRVAVPWVAAAAVTFVALYPALWVNPGGELSAMRQSAGMVNSGEQQFFLGHTTHAPGPLFYLVALPLRITPWFLVGGLVALVAIARRATRAYGLALVVMAGPSFVVLSLAGKQYARYGLLLLVVGAIAVGIVASSLWSDGWGRAGSRGRRWLVGGAAAGAIVHTVVIAPWGIAYFNPLLGGRHTAEKAIDVGTGEGLEQVDAHMRRLADGDCDGTTVTGYLAAATVTCGHLVQTPAEADFVLLYVSERQRLSPETLATYVRGRDLAARIVIRGITYVEIFGPAEPGDDP
jgi:hypothetical protein